jgi:NADH-quinone oxidoreductase subunit D
MTTRLLRQPSEIAAEQLLGPFSVCIDEDGGVVSHAKFKFGYQHRDIEGLLKKLNFAQAMSYSDRVDYLAAPFCNFVFAQAVEKLGQMELPPKSHYARVILLELSRIFSHLYTVGGLAHAAGHAPIFQFSVREREKISNLFEMFCGSRLGFGAICIGGVVADTTDGWLFQVEKAMKEILLFLEEAEEYLLINPLFVGRLRGLMTLSGAQAANYGISGVNLRASGSDIDLRKTSPCAAYSDIAIPAIEVSREGDALTRLRLRLAEIRQSEGIIRAAVAKIPTGNFRILTGPGIFLPAGSVTSRVEGPRGELGLFLVGSGENRAATAKFFTPSCGVVELLPEISRGVCVEDLFVGIHSLDISISEVDR